MGWYDYGYRPYVSAAQRRAQALREIAKRVKKGLPVQPVSIEGRKIAQTFWGNAWCENLEGYSDFENRLPRGRTYVRNGSVMHLEIHKGRIEAIVSGSELYDVRIDIAPLPTVQWSILKKASSGKIGSLVELLQGKLSKGVMEQVTDRRNGLFPKPAEIKMKCSCPDYAGMCKHIAAVMYGVGNRLDSQPQLLFLLRGVDHLELISQTIPTLPQPQRDGRALSTGDLGAIFDIELGDDSEPAPPSSSPKTPKRATTPTPKAPAKTAKSTKTTKKPAKPQPAVAVKATAKATTSTKTPKKAAKAQPAVSVKVSAKSAKPSTSKPAAKPATPNGRKTASATKATQAKKPATPKSRKPAAKTKTPRNKKTAGGD